MTDRRDPQRRNRGRWFWFAAFALACSSEPVESSSPITGLVVDVGALRARISACVGVDASAAVSFFGPPLVQGLPQTAIHCLEAAADCPAVLGCLGAKRDSCSGQDECRGSTALHCEELANHIRTLVVEDCATSEDDNRECTVIDDEKSVVATCHHGECRGDRCEGDVSVLCKGDVEIREDCARDGRVCISGGSGVFCALPARCEHDQCEGSSLSFCRDGYVDAREQCAELVTGGQCLESASGAECAAQVWHPACPQDEPFMSFCEGNRALACYLGALYESRCDAFLDGHCETRERGVGARCRVPGWP